jgi:hypothetical protein
MQAGDRGRGSGRIGLAVGLVAVLVTAAACSGSSDGDGAGSGGSQGPTSIATTTTVPLVWSATATGEHEVDGNYRQGLARADDGWFLTTNDAIYRTDDDFTEIRKVGPAIPPDLAARGYDHMGDPDVADGMLWVPLEKPDKSAAGMVTARYDVDTLELVDSFEVPQHHNAFVAVDDGIAYSADEFSDDTIVRYRVIDGEAVPQEPLELSRTVERIQGADVADGALWLSTDDDHNGLYRVDLRTGAVQDLGTMGHEDGEGEGLDATDLPSGLLHALVADAAIVPMWVVDLQVASRPEG